MSMTDFETKMIKQMEELNKRLGDIHAVLNAMVTEGLVVLPDAGASDN
jgi:hypothetical protein